MIILKTNLNLSEPGQEGSITLKAVTEDDLWAAYNLIQRGDIMRLITFRKIAIETKTGSIVQEKKRLDITVRVDKIDYEQDNLRITGKNIAENKYLQIGQHHSFDLSLNIPFTLYKTRWDAFHLKELDQATNPVKTCNIVILLMEEGLGHLCFVTSNTTSIKQRIELNIPKKRKGQSQHGKQLEKFFDLCITAIKQHVNFQVTETIIVAGPGFTKDQFMEFLQAKAAKVKQIQEIIHKFITCHASSGQKHSLNDVINDPQIKNRLSDTKTYQDVSSLDEFYEILAKDPGRAAYGLKDIKKAWDENAINTLLITDKALKTKSTVTRKQLNEIYEGIKKAGGQAQIISGQSLSGKSNFLIQNWNNLEVLLLSCDMLCMELVKKNMKEKFKNRNKNKKKRKKLKQLQRNLILQILRLL